MIRIPYPPFLTVERELAGNTTPTDPRSQRIRASRKGRPCNEIGLSAQGLSAACPHLCAPDAPCPRWAHHNPLRRGSGEHQGAEIIMPDNRSCECRAHSFRAARLLSRLGRDGAGNIHPDGTFVIPAEDAEFMLLDESWIKIDEWTATKRSEPVL